MLVYSFIRLGLAARMLLDSPGRRVSDRSGLYAAKRSCPEIRAAGSKGPGDRTEAEAADGE